MSEAVKYYICAHIPQGKVLTEKAFEEFVAARLGVEHVMFSVNLWDKMTNVEDILQYDRTYRLVSNAGRVSNVHVEKLAQEGFTLVSATKYMSKIVDYKNYLWNLERENKIDKDLIERVNANGFACLKELADICLKSTEYILFCLSQKPLYTKLSPPYRRVYHRKENNVAAF